METFEKKYNEALDWMQKIYPTLTGADKEDAEHYFPELKESADERIRKELYAFISSVQHNRLCAYNKREEWLTYLEKQKSVQSDTEKQYVRTLESLISDFLHGKQEVDRDYYQQICDWLEERHIEEKPESCDCSRDEESYTNGIHHVLMNPEAYGLIKQKPAAWSDSVAKEMFIKALERAVEQTKKGYELTDCDKHSWWEDFKAYSGIKPAEWSEEDEALLKEIVSFFKDGTTKLQHDLDLYAGFLENKLKSLRPQPKQEWSEEDEKMLRLCENRIMGTGTFVPTKAGLYGMVSWLKSLRPQPHWKPSEEQMKALKVVARGFPADDPDAIDSLLTDLQKLL